MIFFWFRDICVKSKSVWAALLCMIMAVTSGCNVAGPISLKAGRGMYNTAIQTTGNEQMLLNLVRLRYRDTPFFMEVTSVSTSFEFTTAASANAMFPDGSPDSYGLSGGISHMEKPTVIYTPLQGERFVMQVMQPITMKTVLLLYYSGWSIERILRIIVQSINEVKNAPSASGPTPELAPEYEKFLRVAKILRLLQIQGMLHIGLADNPDDKDQPTVMLQIDDEAYDWPDVHELKELLELDPDRSSYKMVAATGETPNDTISIVPRSLNGCLFYISQSVRVPEKHKKNHVVTVTRYKNGDEFDWIQVLGDVMTIHYSFLPPKNAYAAVFYRHGWYYDLTSKSSFSLLMQLFALQAGDIKSAGPVLTLPISG